MSTALTRLKQKIGQTGLPQELSKLSKGAFDSFDSDPGRGVSPILPSALVVG